jgi:hypothetical protein
MSPVSSLRGSFLSHDDTSGARSTGHVLIATCCGKYITQGQVYHTRSPNLGDNVCAWLNAFKKNVIVKHLSDTGKPAWMRGRSNRHRGH